MKIYLFGRVMGPKWGLFGADTCNYGTHVGSSSRTWAAKDVAWWSVTVRNLKSSYGQHDY